MLEEIGVGREQVLCPGFRGGSLAGGFWTGMSGVGVGAAVPGGDPRSWEGGCPFVHPFPSRSKPGSGRNNVLEELGHRGRGGNGCPRCPRAQGGAVGQRQQVLNPLGTEAFAI